MRYFLASFVMHYIWGGLFFVLAMVLGVQLTRLEPLIGLVPFIVILGCLTAGFFALLVAGPKLRPQTLSGYFLFCIPAIAFVVGFGLAVCGLFIRLLVAVSGLR